MDTLAQVSDVRPMRTPLLTRQECVERLVELCFETLRADHLSATTWNQLEWSRFLETSILAYQLDLKMLLKREIARRSALAA
jgi:hypothetical protein